MQSKGLPVCQLDASRVAKAPHAVKRHPTRSGRAGLPSAHGQSATCFSAGTLPPTRQWTLSCILTEHHVPAGRGEIPSGGIRGWVGE